MKTDVQPSERLAVRRKEILDAAKRVFEAHGYAATTMEAVAEEAQIAKGSIYNYFKSKHDLFRTVFLEDLPKNFMDVTARWASQGSAADKIQRLLDLWYSRLQEHKRTGKLVLEFWSAAAHGEQEELAEMFGTVYSHARSEVAAVIAEGVASGDFPSHVQPGVAAALILAVFDGMMLQALLDARITVDESFVTGLKKAVMAGLTSPQPAAGSIRGTV